MANDAWRVAISETVSRKSQIANLFGFILALMSYWGPWVAHRDAGLAVAEVDLVEFPKFMPQYRADELFVWRESFYVPLLVLSIALVVWAATPTPALSRDEKHVAGEGAYSSPIAVLFRNGAGWAGVRWLLRTVALFILVTPSVFNVLESHEFQTQLNMVAIVLALIVLTPLLRRAPSRIVRVLMLCLFLIGAIIPTAQFLYMTPALAQIYHEPIGIGWGMWANLIGFALLALSQLL